MRPVQSWHRWLSAGVMSLLMTLAACGTSRAPAATVNAALLAINHPATIGLTGLKITTRDIGCGGALTVSQPATSLTAASRQQLVTYLQAFDSLTAFGTAISPNEWALGSTSFKYTSWFAPQLPPPPNAVQWLPGGAQCFGRVDVDNQAAAPITVSRLGVRLTAPSMTNTLTYNLLDLCSVAGLATCVPPHKNVAPDCFFFAAIALQAGPAGATSDAPVRANTPTDTYGHHCVLPVSIAPG